MRFSRKALNLLLMSIAFLVWIVFFYRIIFEENQEENSMVVPEQKERVTNIKSNKINDYPETGQKDPFITPYNQYIAKPKQTVQNKPARKEEPAPKLRLLGTIDNKMAIIAFPDNSVKYLKVKQMANNVTIVKINKDKVEFTYKQKTYEIEN
jgi:Tfp pilus assembly protein PilP